jgi:hypothetical protein
MQSAFKLARKALDINGSNKGVKTRLVISKISYSSRNELEGIARLNYSEVFKI